MDARRTIPMVGAVLAWPMFPPTLPPDLCSPVRRRTAKSYADKQERMYAPCGCGSGKKYKFCCRKKGG